MHVLVIDHDAASRAAVADVLGEHRVTLAATGEEGLAALAVGDVDLVLLDAVLPGLGGLATLARIRGGRHRAVPVALLTARATELDHVRGLRGGADAYLVKPFGGAELAREVERLTRATPEERAAHRAAALSRAELLRQVELRFGDGDGDGAGADGPA